MELAILRLLHLSFGFLWAAGGVILGFWVTPAVAEAGPAAGAVMKGVVVDRRMPQVMTISGLITLLTGARLYMLKFSMGWLATPEGVVLTLGALLALGGFVIGIASQRPTAAKLTALQQEVAASGVAPTAEQQAEIARLQGRMVRLGKVLGAHLGVALVLMASMRLAQVLSM